MYQTQGRQTQIPGPTPLANFPPFVLPPVGARITYGIIDGIPVDVDAVITTWSSGRAYQVNDLVSSNGRLYRRLISGAGTTAPASDTDNWVEATGSGGGSGNASVIVDGINPTTRTDGTALQRGDTWYHPWTNSVQRWDGQFWDQTTAGHTVEFVVNGGTAADRLDLVVNTTATDAITLEVGQ